MKIVTVAFRLFGGGKQLASEEKQMLRHNRQKPAGSNPEPPSLEQCLAKSYKTAENIVKPGRTVLDHCQIVGEVARALIMRMPHWLRDDLFPEGAELIAAAHDIGKVSPTFQKKIYDSFSQKDEAVLSALKAFNSEAEYQWGGHAGVSQVSIEAENVGNFIPKILGQHHGYSPILAAYQASSEVFGGQPWQVKRSELLMQLKRALGTEFPFVSTELQARILAGLTTVSDWIGSGSMFEDPDEDWQTKITAALDTAGFVQPQYKNGLSFTDIFNFSAKDAQAKLITAVNGPGVYVLEAPMGLGKTEAALFSAYELLRRNHATGIYFALPTQLTSDKIHERVNKFLARILDDESPNRFALLVHGNAWFSQFEMGEEGNPGGAWFNEGKRGILAPFAVGTVDQALMAVMNVKHGFVRTFGLAGKVVILDEVHSYDTFTGTILDALVKALRQLHCTVIILTATLTGERRGNLLGITPQAQGYPLITAQPNFGEPKEILADDVRDVQIIIGHQQEAASIEEALRRAEEGQQVLWIENTVKEAQDLYKILASRTSEFDVECGLLHSRFIQIDRKNKEKTWIIPFGKEGGKTRCRKGRILVGTQVLEQSLDIDADFLITRISPTDMLLQRMGRLWRHEKNKRPQSAQREIWILSPDLSDAINNPEIAFGHTAKVYAPYVLCRSLEIWQGITRITLPGQIRELIEATYAPRQDENDHMKKHLCQVESKRSDLNRLALMGLSQGLRTQPEERAQTRYSDLESAEVLLIRTFQHDHKKRGTLVTLLNNEQLFVPWNRHTLPRKRWREISALLMQNTLKVAKSLAPRAISKSQLQWLGDYFYLGRQEYDESILRVALVDESGAIKSPDNSVVNQKYDIRYDASIGYQADLK